MESLAEWGLSTRLHFNFLSPQAKDLALLHFLVVLFTPHWTFSISPCSTYSFFIIGLHNMIAIDHMTKSALGCLKTPLVNTINPTLFNLVSGQFLGQEQKTVTFFAKISDWSLGYNILLLRNFLNWVPTVQITLCTVFHIPIRMIH